MSPDKPSKDISLRLFSVSISSKGLHLSREWWFHIYIYIYIYAELLLSTKTVADPNVNQIHYIILISVVPSNDDIRSISSRIIDQASMVKGFSTWMRHCVISPWFQNNSYSSCRHIHKRSEDNMNPNLMDLSSSIPKPQTTCSLYAAKPPSDTSASLIFFSWNFWQMICFRL